MTIKEAAQLYGKSRQAIYQRLQASCQPLNELKNPETGVLTEKGEALLKSIYCEGDRQEAVKPGKVDTQIDSLLTQIQRLESEVKALTEKVDGLQADKEYLQRALDQAQQLQAMAFKRLPAPPAEEQKKHRGFLFFFRGDGKKDNQE